MIIVNMSAFPGGERARREAVNRLLTPYLRPEQDCSSHPYAVALVSLETGHAYELVSFEAPCADKDAAGNIRAVIAGLQEAADQVRDGHADILAEPADTEAADVPAHVLVDVLSLAQCHVSEAEVMSWTKDQRRQAEHWAQAVHLHASDNHHVPVPDQPSFVAQGDFMVGDIVQRRSDNGVAVVTGGGIWLNSWYRLLATRNPDTGALPYYGRCADHGVWARNDGPDVCPHGDHETE